MDSNRHFSTRGVEKESFINSVKKTSFYQYAKKKEFAKELEERLQKDGRKGRTSTVTSPTKKERPNDFVSELNEALEYFVNMEQLIGVEKIKSALENQKVSLPSRRFNSKMITPTSGRSSVKNIAMA
jgi:hypothetical protein